MTTRAKILAALSLCGLFLNLLLLYWKVTSGPDVAGCSGSNDCANVMASRWSMVAGVPIAAAGAVIYAVLLLAIVGNHQRLAMACQFAIGGAAVWFAMIQIIAIGHVCPWCMAAHAAGVSIAVLGFIWRDRDLNLARPLWAAMAAVMILLTIQIFGPAPPSHRLEDNLKIAPSRAAGVHSEGTGRMIEFDDGRKIFNVTALPLLGSSDAPSILVEYFDYQCPACRQMSVYLKALMDRHPEKIGVILLPVPLDHRCNPDMSHNESGHPGSCEFTRIALAVWRASPEAFPAFHRAMISDPPPSQVAAEELAMKALEPADLQSALRDPWIDRLMTADIADWRAVSTRTSQLPKLLFRGKRVLHGVPASQEEFIQVIESELGL